MGPAFWLFVIAAILAGNYIEARAKAARERELADRNLNAALDREALKHLREEQSRRDREFEKARSVVATVTAPAPVAALAAAPAAIQAPSVSPVVASPVMRRAPRSTAELIREIGEVKFQPKVKRQRKPKVVPALSPAVVEGAALAEKLAEEAIEAERNEDCAAALAERQAEVVVDGEFLAAELARLQEECERDEDCAAALAELEAEERAAMA